MGENYVPPSDIQLAAEFAGMRKRGNQPYFSSMSGRYESKRATPP